LYAVFSGELLESDIDEFLSFLTNFSILFFKLNYYICAIRLSKKHLMG